MKAIIAFPCPTIGVCGETSARLRESAMALLETAPRGRHILHTMNSTNVMPISSINNATESYSSQCQLPVIMSFHPGPFSWF